MKICQLFTDNNKTLFLKLKSIAQASFFEDYNS